jgi:hypothetical protein
VRARPSARSRSATPTIKGTVYLDEDRDSSSDRSEVGRHRRPVSNGREVVKTDANGRLPLPAYDGHDRVRHQAGRLGGPAGRPELPRSSSTTTCPKGSPPAPLRRLPADRAPAAGDQLPAGARRGGQPADGDVDCAVIGDTQTYSNQELGFLRDGVVNDLAKRDDLGECGALIVGDVAGDDLGLYPRIKEVMSLAGMPVRAVPGNHDIDFDAEDDEHSFDTYKREIGPEYYSYDVGDTHFVGLDNVKYPCTSEDDADGDHAFCNDPANHPTYTGVIGEEQLTWLANDLAHVSKDKLVVIGTHIPLVSFLDQDFVKHQTDDVRRLYALLEGREALSVSGHTQVVENLAPGTATPGWKRYLGVDAVPFRHLTVGAASGSWWTGDITTAGSNSGLLPEALQRRADRPATSTSSWTGAPTPRPTERPVSPRTSR